MLKFLRDLFPNDRRPSGWDILRLGKLRVYVYYPVNYFRDNWCLNILWSSGAGTIGGWTAFLAWRMHKPGTSYYQGQQHYYRRLIQVGFTRRGGFVPYS